MYFHCVFCDIASGREPAKIRYQDDEVMVIDNLLHWAPVMLLVVHKAHMTQEEMWQKKMDVVGKVAVEMGQKYCPEGFRLLSNFGWDALQTQDHAHLHIIGGRNLGHYA